jgi:hypothetical protein
VEAIGVERRAPMFVLAVVLSVLLLLETVPSAVAGLNRTRSGLTRLDELTRLGLVISSTPRFLLLSREND